MRLMVSMQSLVVDKTNAGITNVGSYLPLPTQGTNPAGNTPVESIRVVSDRFADSAYGFFLGKRVAYPVVANYVRNTWGKFGLVRSMFSSSTGLFSFQFSSMDGLNAMLENGPWFIRSHPIILKKWNPDVNLLKEDVGNVSVWVKLHGFPVTTFSEDGLSAIATKLGIPIMLDSYNADMCLQSWGRSSYARVMIELRADVELKDTIVVAMPKINGEGFYTCNVRVEYEWKPPRCACCKIFGHTQVECPKNPGLGAGAGEIKKKKSSQAPKGVLVGPKMAFKPTQEYRHVLKKHTANSSGNKKKGVDSTNMVSDSNPFEVLNSVENDMEMCTNGGRKFENLIIDGQAILVDEASNPLKKIEYPSDHDSEDEVASVDNDMARSLASKRTGFGTQSLLEQWRDSHGDDDYDEDPYDDDMYEG
ncbi:retrotransposon protein, putative, ty1-copia subclass [Tanacetum coccineum]